MMIKIEEVLNKIKAYRKDKEYSQEYIAYKLDISQAAYTNIENQISKLCVERIIQIAEILEQLISGFLEKNLILKKKML